MKFILTIISNMIKSKPLPLSGSFSSKTRISSLLFLASGFFISKSFRGKNIENRLNIFNLKMKFNIVYLKKNFKNSLIIFIYFIDFTITTLLVLYLLSHILIMFLSLIDNFIHYTTYDIICNVIGNNESKIVHSTTIIHDDGCWSNSIRQIFIYGAGVLRLHFLRGGSPLSRTFVLGSTIAADAGTRFVLNAINDPVYLENHIANWRNISQGNKQSYLNIHVNKYTETLKKVEEINTESSDVSNITNLTSNENLLDNWSEMLFNKVLEILKPILEPVSVDYSNEVLASQIYGLSIILFVLSVLIIILLIAFFINVLILIYSDKLLKLFTNKYIRWYINFNRKIIGIEVCFLAVSLLYFMYYLSYGIHFIATHPITFN